MVRKDLKVLCSALSGARKAVAREFSPATEGAPTTEPATVFRRVVDILAHDIGATNAQFDRAKFYKAIGLEIEP